MKRLIELSLARPRAITVIVLAIAVLGILAATKIAVDILPQYNSPAVQTLTFYSGMPADEMANTITNPLERWTGTAGGIKRQESRSILGASIIRNYFYGNVDPNGALTQVQSLALAEIPNLPPGSLPPIVLPYDPTATVPACIVAVDSPTQGESVLYDVARYEVRNMIMTSKGANSPVVFGGKIRAILALLDPIKMEARGLSATDVLDALEHANLFLPTGDAKMGTRDYAIGSNAMYTLVDRMADIPIRSKTGQVYFLGDVARPRDTHFIQTSIVRINGKPEVYIPVYRGQGASTLEVVDNLKEKLPSMPPRLTRPNIDLKLVMDQSIYVRQSIKSLITEAGLGAVLCSLVILIFLGQWRMTVIAVLSIPIAVLAAVVCLYLTGNTVNVMTLAGLALAIGPLVDSAIICLENTHRHLSEGADPQKAALLGASEVAMPELVASTCTLLVLAPLAMMPGLGQFLFKPMALAVAFTMISGYLLSRSFVPSRAGEWLHAHAHPQGSQGQEQPAHGTAPAASREPAEERITSQRAAGSAPPVSGAAGEVPPTPPPHPPARRGFFGRISDKIQAGIDAGIRWYTRQLDRVMRHRWLTVLTAAGLLALVLVLLGPNLRREFFPEVDAGAFEMYVRADTGTRIEVTEAKIARVEELLRKEIGDDLDIIISELGVWADWSAAYTPNTGPMDADIKVQLKGERQHSSQFYADRIRRAMAANDEFADLEVAFNTGGTVRSALNEGSVTPIDVRIEGKNLEQGHELAERIRKDLVKIDGVVDARIMQRLDYPGYRIDVDRAKARDLGLNTEEVMKNVIASINTSIQYNKHNFWIDPVSKNQYYVGVSYPEKDINSLNTILNVSVTSPTQSQPIPLSNFVNVTAMDIPALVTHTNLLSTIDLTMNVHGRDLGHVADDIVAVLNRYGQSTGKFEWQPHDPKTGATLAGTKMTLTGEFGHMEDTFVNFGFGLALAVVFIYFLMVILLDSYLVPIVILSAVPVGLVGVLPMLYFTGTAINAQSLLGVIFMVGIIVSNTVLLTDFAQHMREEQGMSPTEAIRHAAAIRARPVVMTALAALFALIPMALALERGSEANAPLGRAVIGGLIAGLFTTLVVVPAFYSLIIRDTKPHPGPAQAHPESTPREGTAHA